MTSFHDVLRALRVHKGQFGRYHLARREWDVPGGALRHRTRKDKNGCPLCPLAVLKGDHDGDDRADNHLAIPYALTLGVSPFAAIHTQRCADYPSHPGRDELLEACL